MPEVAVKTRDQIAVDQIQFILRQDWFQPETLKKYIGALKNWQPNQLSVIIDGQIISYNRIVADLQQFLRSLPPERRQNLAADGLAPDQLDLLDSIIDEVAGSAATAEAAQPPPANIPQDLKNLVAEFDKAQQAAVSAQAKRRGWSPEELRKQIAFQDQITVQMHQVRQYTLSQLEWAITNSTALENLAASLGVRPQDVKNLALERAKISVDKNITALTFRQARSLITDPVQLAAYYTARLKADVMADDLLILAAVDKDPKTKQKYLDTALKKTKETVAQETEKAKPAIEAAAKNLEEHPTVRKATQTDAVAAVKQVETVSLGRPPQQQLNPKKSARLINELKKQPNPAVRRRIIANALKISASQAAIVETSLNPAIANFAASTQHFNPLLAADTTGILADALRRPHLFPKPFVDAIKSGKITDAEVAEIYQMARLLDIPPNAVILSRFGVNAKDLATRLQTGPKFLGFIPMGHGVDPKDATITKLSDLAAAQKQLTDSLKAPPPLLPPQTTEQFLKTAARNSRANRFSEFFDQINLFRLPSAFSYNLGRIPPLGSLGNSGSAFVSGLRIQSGFFNTVSNVMGYFNNTVAQTPSFLAAPFRAVGSAISNTIINPVKTWANTQIKSGLARAGAWLAKKGVTEGAKKVGMALLGKGTAALLAQAVPVAGQIAGALMLLSALGDIGKFIWANRKEIGFGLASGFLLGQLLLGKLLGFLSSLGTVGLTTGIGALLGTIFIPIPFVGTAIGAGLGFGAGLMINAAGGLGAALSGLGTALGSAAAGLSSFIGALTAPSLVAGLGTTIAAVGIGGLTLGGILSIFQGNILLPGALFVPSGEGTTIPTETVCENPPTEKPLATDIKFSADGKYAFPVTPYNRVYHTCSHWNGQPATDIGIIGDTAANPPSGEHLPVIAFTSGTIYSIAENDTLGGKYVILQGDDGLFYYYAHNCTLYVNPGARVNVGDVIATTDNTGEAATTVEHLHFHASTTSKMTTTDPTDVANFVCASKLFEEKLNLGKCSSSEWCTNNP